MSAKPAATKKKAIKRTSSKKANKSVKKPKKTQSTPAPTQDRPRAKLLKPPTDVTGVRLPLWVIRHHTQKGMEENVQLGTRLARIATDVAKKEGAVEPEQQWLTTGDLRQIKTSARKPKKQAQ